MSRRSARGIVRVIIFIGLLAAIVGGALFAASRLMSPNFIIAQLQEQVKQQTGRTLAVGGRPSISFLPRISVVLPDVRLSNPPGLPKGDFLRVKKLELQVELWPLLQREVVLRRLRMMQPNIHLLVDRRGRNNWSFAPAGRNASASGVSRGAKTSPSARPARGPDKANRPGNNGGATGDNGGAGGMGGELVRRIRLAPVVVRDGHVLFEDLRTGTRQELGNVDVVIKLSSPTSPLDVQGGAVWRKQRVKFSLFVKDPARLAGKGSPLEAFIQTAGAKIEYTGLTGFGNGLALAGRVSASGPSLRGLLRWLGVGITPQGGGLGRFSLNSGISAAKNVFTLSKLQLALDDSRAQGTVKLDLSGKSTALKAALGVDKVVTDLYLGPPPPSAAPRRAPAPGMPSQNARPAPQPLKSTARTPRARARGTTWSNAPVIPDLPKDLVADVRLSVNSLRHRQLKMGPGAAHFVLRGGGLSARLEKMRFYGGGLSGKLSIIPGKSKPRIAAAFRVDKVSARPFLVDLAGFDYLSGRLTGEVDVKSFGRSQLEIVGNMAGLANLTFREGKVHGVDLVKLMELVQKGIVNGWRFDKDATTDFVELAAKFVIVDGIAGVRQLGLKGPLLRISGKGEVDLLRQWLDLSFGGALVKRKKGKEKALLEMPVPLLVKGPWWNPKIYPDIAGILKDPKAAYQRLQSLLRGIGAKKPAAKVEKVRRKVKEKVKAESRKIEAKVERKLEKQLGKVLGKDKAGKAAEEVTDEARKQVKKLFKGIFGK